MECSKSFEPLSVECERLRLSRVVARKGSRKTLVRIGESRESITVLACINAAGTAMPSMRVVKGKTQRNVLCFKHEEAPKDERQQEQVSQMQEQQQQMQQQQQHNYSAAAATTATAQQQQQIMLKFEIGSIKAMALIRKCCGFWGRFLGFEFN